MKKFLLNVLLIGVFYFANATIMLNFLTSPKGYDSKLCSLITGTNGSVNYNLIRINRKGNRIKAEYMSWAGSASSIEARYNRFALTHPNIVAYTSGAYMIGSPGNWTPEGLNIDHGVVVNKKLENERFDALVIVYPSQGGGGIAVNNLDNNAVTTSDGVFKIRNSDGIDNQRFIQWAQRNGATVFQTHLLAEKNILKLERNGATNKDPRERRFLIASKDQSTGDTYHYILQRKSPATLYDGAYDALDFLKKRGIDVLWMINLDTGWQDTFGFFTSDGKKHPNIKGQVGLDGAANLLVYYYE